MMINVNDNIKMAYSLSTKQIDRIILDSTPHYITNVEYSDNCYQDGNVFGTAEARQLQFEIENSINVERKEFEYQTGIVINDVVNWISLGNFITYDVEEDDTNGITKVVAMDNMIKSNVLYDHTSLDYSVGVTIKEILEDALEQCGLELGTNSFVNSDFVCYSDQFEDNALIRQVIIACAQISGTFAKIRSDNKLYLINPNKASYGDLVTEEEIYVKTEKGNKLILLEKRIDNQSGVADSDTFFDLKDYSNTTLKRNTHEINTLVLGMANIEGENVTIRDEQMIAEDGNENKIVINDNPFAYTQALRSQLITPIFNSIKGFAYTAYELNYQGLPYLECGDSVSIKTIEGSSIESYVFRYTFKSPNGLDSSMQAPSLTDAEVLYENVEPLDTRLKRTEIIVDKENQQIQSIVAEIGDRSGKTTTITQDLDGVISKVEEVIDITDEVEDTDPLTLTNAMKGSLLELHIFGNNQVFDYLYPRNNLYPSNDLYPMGDSRIRVWTNNICPDGVDNWINGYLNSSGVESHNSPFNSSMIVSDYIRIDDDIYLSLENEEYKIWSVAYYDIDKVFISRSEIKNYEDAQTIPNDTKYLRFEIVNEDFHYDDQDYDNNYPEIIPAEILSIKPMIMYGDTKGEYRGYNNAIIELGVTDVLRRLVKEDGTVLRDSFDLVNNKASITRRIGVDSHGDLYDLVTPVITDLGEIIIPIAEGENYFDIVNYNATCRVRWVIRNTYTSVFASTVELESSITQLANSINLQVSKKVGNDEIIARINMAVLGIDDAEVPEDVEKSVIEIEANKISIASDNFSITKTGVATFKQGTIGNWNLINGFLYSNHYEGSTLFQSGLSSLNTGGGTSVYLYAGADVTSGSTSLTNSNFYIRNDGLCKAKWFQVNGEDGYFYVDYNSGRHAMALTKTGLRQFLDNSSNNIWASYQITFNGSVADGQAVYISDAKYFAVIDNVHSLYLAKFTRIGNNSEPSRVDFFGASYVDGALIQTASSDERLKKNIKKSKTNALEIIDDIDFYEFDWKDENKGHIDIGFVAQRLQKQYEKLVIHSEGIDNKGNPNDTYQIDLLNTLALSMKGLQELSKKVNELENEINKLKGEKNV